MSSDTYQSAKSRLEEILEEVGKDDISLDDALDLYEEAVKLSLAACDMSESDLDLALDDGEDTRESCDVPDAAAKFEAAIVESASVEAIENVSENLS